MKPRSPTSQTQYEQIIFEGPANGHFEDAFRYFLAILSEPDFDGRGSHYAARTLLRAKAIEDISDNLLQGLVKLAVRDEVAVHYRMASELMSFVPLPRVVASIEKMESQCAGDIYAKPGIVYALALHKDLKALDILMGYLTDFLTRGGWNPRVYCAIFALTHHRVDAVRKLFDELAQSPHWAKVSTPHTLDLRRFFLSQQGENAVFPTLEHFFHFQLPEFPGSFFVPNGAFLSEFRREPGWQLAIDFQEALFTDLVKCLTPAEQGSYAARIGQFFNPQPKEPTLKHVCLDWIYEAAPFRAPFAYGAPQRNQANVGGVQPN